jgi:hypothetical protein
MRGFFEPSKTKKRIIIKPDIKPTIKARTTAVSKLKNSEKRNRDPQFSPAAIPPLIRK